MAVCLPIGEGHMQVEVPGMDDRVLIAPEPIRPPDPRGVVDFITAPCKHECATLKHRRHSQQAHGVLSSLDPVRSAMTRASDGHCGLDSTCCFASTVEVAVGLDRPGWVTKTKLVKEPCYVPPPFTALVSLSSTHDWRPLISRRFALDAMQLYGTKLYVGLVQTESSHGSATHGGVVVMS